MKEEKETVDMTLFYRLTEEICETEKYLMQKGFFAHADETVFDHCVNVARDCYVYAMRKKGVLDIVALTKAALLHDYYLYDWRKNPAFTFHGFKHALIAARNAAADFGLTKKERMIIESHMFPLNLFHLPRCKEAWVLTYFDKKRAIEEIFFARKQGKRV